MKPEIRSALRWLLATTLFVTIGSGVWLLGTRYLQAPLNEINNRAARTAPNPGVYRSYYSRKKTEGSALVGIAISGGGSRAANFAASVLSELDQMGILDQATVISSVSGGSLAAGYYVSRAQNPLRAKDSEQFWTEVKDALSQELRTKWLTSLGRPDHLLRTVIPGYTRTTVMADVLDDLLSNGLPSPWPASDARKHAESYTFAHLPADGPLLLMNATAQNDLYEVPAAPCTNRGWRGQGLRLESVSFTETFFHDCLNSNLGDFRLADAVMASAAFPGVFNSVTLAAYPAAGSQQVAQYLHLIDGGPADNLGLEGIIGAAAQQAKGNGHSDPPDCLIIAIDAFASGDPERRQWRRDIRGIVGRVVDPNFNDSIDAMLSRRRFDMLQRIGMAPRRLKNEAHQRLVLPASGDQPAMSLTAQYTQIKEQVPLLEMAGESLSDDETWKGHLPQLACLVWHIALDNVGTQMLGQIMMDGRPKQVVGGHDSQTWGITAEQWRNRPEVKHRLGVAGLTRRLSTDFNLRGPPNCTQKQLSDAIWEAGRLAVREDYQSRAAVCKWMDDKGWGGLNCLSPDKPHKQSVLAFRYIVEPDGGFAVDCASP